MAELIYGTTLSVPDDIAGTKFFKDPPPTEFLQQLHNTTTNFQMQPMSAHGQHQSYIAPDLLKVYFVFVQWDTHRAPLQPPYDAPFPVIPSTSKHFVLDYRNHRDTITTSSHQEWWTTPSLLCIPNVVDHWSLALGGELCGRRISQTCTSHYWKHSYVCNISIWSKTTATQCANNTINALGTTVPWHSPIVHTSMQSKAQRP